MFRPLIKPKFTVQESNCTVLEPNHHRIHQILALANDATNCEFRPILRNVLYRASEEANYLSFQFDGDESEEFKKAKIYLEWIILDLPDMLDYRGNILPHCRSTILEAVALARYLIAIERAQTVAQLDMLEGRLEGCACSDCQGELKVA
ncbi:hypothetical protein [Methylobacterium radiotolerans]|uniref:hypothetical protein n=1 Tax=Methylobacterium radiotolerans TaxID=31998 RepID=UPI00111593DB|nr:hypothetical protein [Methylobacterium radiotolerans]